MIRTPILLLLFLKAPAIFHWPSKVADWFKPPVRFVHGMWKFLGLSPESCVLVECLKPTASLCFSFHQAASLMRHKRSQLPAELSVKSNRELPLVFVLPPNVHIQADSWKSSIWCLQNDGVWCQSVWVPSVHIQKIKIIGATYAMLTCSCNLSSCRDTFTVTRGSSYSEKCLMSLGHLHFTSERNRTQACSIPAGYCIVQWNESSTFSNYLHL